MKRVLIITYYWPPSSGSGVQRWLMFSKYLPRVGWQPVVYTPENPDFALRDESLLGNIPEACEVIKRPIWEPYTLYRKLSGKSGEPANAGQGPRGPLSRLAGWVRGTFFIPDPRRFWVRPSVNTLSRYLDDHPVDALVTTGPPHSMHLIGLGLKRRRPELPWLADMRDPWATFDIHASFMNARSRAKNRHYQDQVLREADRLLLTSPGARKEFPGARPESVVILNNGYEPRDVEPLSPPASADGTFRLMHSGLLNSIRDVPALWRALAALVRRDAALARALRLELIGNVAPEIAHRLQQDSDLKDRVQLLPWLDHDALLYRQREASVFLAIVNQSQNAASQIPGKIYEALGAGKPVLAICPPDSALAGLIRETRGGVAVDAEDEAGLMGAVEDFWHGHQQGRAFHNDRRAVQAYTREALTRKLAAVLDTLVTK